MISVIFNYYVAFQLSRSMYDPLHEIFHAAFVVISFNKKMSISILSDFQLGLHCFCESKEHTPN